LDWEKLFSASASKMQADLQEVRASVEHRGLKGNLNEHTFSEWLRLYLPGVLEVAAGEIIDSLGQRSKQTDVLVFDSLTTPKFFSRANVIVLPVEPVFSIVEVKTYLNKVELKSAFENMKVAKSLQKRAYHDHGHPTEKTLYGMKTQRWPLQFFIFAYESDSLDSLLSHLRALNGSQPIDKQIDCVCVLDKGLLVHSGPDGLQPIPMPNTAMIAKASPKALLTFYALLAHLLGQATTEPVALHPYLAHIQH
jgi:hypothetical protein